MSMPVTSWPAPPRGLDPDRLVWAETVRGGGYTHLVVARGTTVRLTDLEGEACAHLGAHHADEPRERLDVADTVKIQERPLLTAGCLLLSGLGRVLATVVQDTSGRHDPLFSTPAARDLLRLAATKYDLGPRADAPSIAFFQGVSVDDDGTPRFPGSAGPGASVTIRAELPLVVLIANTGHPLDPRPEGSCGRLEVLAWPRSALANKRARRLFESDLQHVAGPAEPAPDRRVELARDPAGRVPGRDGIKQPGRRQLVHDQVGDNT